MNREQMEQRKALMTIEMHKQQLTVQQYRTFKGQIEAGDVEGFRKGLERILREKK